MRIGIDTGGTFTDCVYVDSSGLQVRKVPSTPDDPGEAVLRAVREIAVEGPMEIRHGTTVGTNALLERKGARVAFVTTSGFEDAIAIGRQARPKLYDWSWRKEPPLAPSELRFGAAERTASDGSMLQGITEAELHRLKTAVASVNPEAIAVCFLFSFANPANEAKVATALRELGIPVCASHEILPEFREFERGSTVLINAYLLPKMQSYLQRLDRALAGMGSRLDVMQSSGGIIPAAIAAREPVRTILSGPAGGVVGAATVARESGWTKILTFDMGGTSTDVASVEGGAAHTTKESQIFGMPIAVPALKIHTVGAGGGSLAAFDKGGVLRVGPQSAGADPGPICYGRGEIPTVTDANLLLGRIHPDWFLGGEMQLREHRNRQVFEAAKGRVETVERFAEGIVRLADTHMERALRRISIEQGNDPREFVLVSFGGAGPLHACALARALKIPQVIIPPFPGALSAFGILVSDFVRDYSRTVMLRPDDPRLSSHLQSLAEQGRKEMAAECLEGYSSPSLDLRYAGQGYEIAVPFTERFVSDFHRRHEQRFGYSDERRAIEVVNVNLRMIARTEPITLPKYELRNETDARHAIVTRRPIYEDDAWHAGVIYDRERLQPGNTIEGPAVIVEYSATTFIPGRAVARVDEWRNLLIEAET